MTTLPEVDPVSPQPLGIHSACFSFSAADRWLGTEESPGCTASVGLSLKAPKRPAGAAAEEGSRLHALAERMLRGLIKPPQLEMTDREILEPLLEIVPPSAAIEHRVDLKEIDPELYGTADSIWHGVEGVLHVLDLKTGYVPAGFLQLALYALASWRGEDVIKLHIYQPRSPGPALETREHTSKDMLELGARVRQAVTDVRSGNVRFAPGNRCRFCPALLTCPAVQILLEDSAAFVVSEGIPGVKAIDNDKLDLLLVDLKVMAALSKAAEDEAVRRAEAGTKFSSWKLVDRQAKRRWVDESVTIGFLKAAGIDPYAPREVISPAQADKALRGVDKENLLDLQQYMDLSSKESTGHTIVPRDSKRKEVVTTEEALINVRNAALRDWSDTERKASKVTANAN